MSAPTRYPPAFFAVINVSIYDIDFAALFHSEIVSKT